MNKPNVTVVGAGLAGAEAAYRLLTRGYPVTLYEMKRTDLAHARIYDRILEMCIPLKINNQNIRRLNAATRLNKAKTLLSGETD